MPKIDWKLVLVGGALSVVANFLFTYTFNVISIARTLSMQIAVSIVGIFIATSAVAIVILLQVADRNYTQSGLPRVKKLRLVFLGVSLFSFLFAVVDMVVYFAKPPYWLELSNDPPYLWFGSIPFSSLLGSFLMGALFGLAEKLLDVMEK
jgi:hypothetical protein